MRVSWPNTEREVGHAFADRYTGNHVKIEHCTVQL